MLIKEDNQIFYLCNRKKVNISLLMGVGYAEILYCFDLKHPGAGDSYVENYLSMQPPQKWIRADRRRWRKITRKIYRVQKRKEKTDDGSNGIPKDS